MRKFMYFMLIALLFSFLNPTTTNAETNVEVKVEYGVDNKVQKFKGFPVRVQLKNNGEYIKGDLVVFSSPSYNASGSYVVPVEIGAGETKTVELSVKGMNEYFSYYGNTPPNFISFYEGGVEKGKEIKLKGNASAKPRYLGDNRLVVGVLSNNFDAVNYFKLIRHQSEPIELLNVSADNIPTQSFGLEMFDVLLVHDFAISTLTSEQQTAIKQWVASGGSIIYDTKIGISNDLGELQDFLLFQPSTEVALDSLVEDGSLPTGISTFTGQGSDENAQVIAKDGEVPLVYHKSIGLGKVTQVNSNLGSNAWKDWEHLNLWWRAILQKASSKNVNSYHHPSFYENLYELTSVGESFPGSIISVPLLIGAFIIYLIVLIPVLYFILYKKDKREHAWWIIPTIAITTSVMIFVIGAKDRIAGTQINESTILLMNEDTSQPASGVGIVSILTNSGGAYKISTEHEGVDLFPIVYGYDNNFETARRHAYIQTGVQGTEITYNNVDYWSIRSALGKVQSVQLGEMNIDLGIEGEKIVGTVENLLPYELKDAHLLAGSSATKLGDIGIGEKFQVNSEITQKNVANALTAPTQFVSGRVFPEIHKKMTNSYYGTNIEKDELEEWRKYQMLSMLLNNNQVFSVDQPILIGYVHQSILEPKVNGKSENSTSIHLVAIPVKMQIDEVGIFNMKEEHFSPTISVMEGERGTIYHNGLDYGEQFIHLGPGSYTIQYQLPDIINKEKDSINEIKLKLRTRNEMIQYFLFNSKTNEFEDLPNESTVTIDSNVEEYINENNSIQIMVKIDPSTDSEITVPAIEIEGELNNDRN
ncbi:hypothetical protein ACWE42_20050 [Sutcliffiella cohnii]